MDNSFEFYIIMIFVSCGIRYNYSFGIKLFIPLLVSTTMTFIGGFLNWLEIIFIMRLMCCHKLYSPRILFLCNIIDSYYILSSNFIVNETFLSSQNSMDSICSDLPLKIYQFCWILRNTFFTVMALFLFCFIYLSL